MITVTPLFSGSKGNCTLVSASNVHILLDAGFGYKAICCALQKLGLDMSQIDAVVVTHEHADHIGGLPMIAKKHNLPIFVPRQIAQLVATRSCSNNVQGVDGSFCIGNVQVDMYECSHDSVCCFGYKFSCNGYSVGCVTDTGSWGKPLVEFLSDCTTILLESNHDVSMLAKGNYPMALKRRILSDFGHLSNQQTALILKELHGTKVKNVFLAHLSEQNNTKELAFTTVVQTLLANGIVEGKDMYIYVADQYQNEVTL